MNFSGMNCLITGANSGLGFAVSRRLARKGAHTILLCRDRERGKETVRAIEQETPNAAVDLMICDLASMASIQNFISDFKAEYSKLDILYNNAAVMKRKRTVTDDGYEMMFQVNYLAPFILMNSLLELLKNSSSHQIVNCARPTDDLRLDFDDLQFQKNYRMYDSFFQTKLCLLLAGLEMSRRHSSYELTVTMAVPGTFKSNLVRDNPWFGWVKNLFSAPVDAAAENMVHVITLVEAQKESGCVFEKRQAEPLAPYWQDRDVGERLWSLTESLIKNGRDYQSDINQQSPVYIR